jgi:hypothetical protein
MLWTVACALLLYWLTAYAVAGALKPPASYVQNPARCQRAQTHWGK